MSSIAHRGLVHVGMDVAKDSIAVAVLSPDRDVAEIDKIFHDDESVRRLINRLGRPAGLWACDEAGPTCYGLYRLSASMGVRCDVVAPSLIPKGAGDRVKTDRTPPRRVASRRGAHRDRGAVTGARSGAGFVPHPRGHGARPHVGVSRIP